MNDLQENLTLITCSHNTPEVTMNLLRSFAMHHKSYPYNLLISENSTDEKTCELLDAQEIKYFRNPGMMHADGMNFLFKRCKTKHALLLDTDIIFLKNLEEAYDEFVEENFALCGEYNDAQRGGKLLYPRIAPWFCFVDMEKLKANNIEFEDMELFESNNRDPKKLRKYDVACTMYEKVMRARLKFGPLATTHGLFKHYEGMSWRTFWYENGKHTNKIVYEWGKSVQKQYDLETKKFLNVSVKGFFK